MAREDLAADERFGTLQSRVAHMDLVDESVSAWAREQPKQELFETLIAAHVPCVPFRDLQELVHDPNLHERGALTWIDHPDLGRIVVQRSALRFEGTNLTELVPSGRLGSRTNRSIASGCLGPGEVAELREQG